MTQGWNTIMQTWAVIAQKGGAGKTTLSLHVSIALSDFEQKVELLDVDPQNSAYRWTVQRKGKSPVATPIVAAQIFDQLDRVRNRSTDIVVVDTSPRADRESLIVASAADMIIVPVRPSPLDVPAVLDTLDLLDRAGHLHKVVLVLNAVAARTNEGDLAAQYLKKQAPELCPFFIGERAEFRHSLLEGQGVTEHNRTSPAAKEIVAVTKWLLRQSKLIEEGKTDGKGTKPVRKERRAAAG